jgi:hypothetical protein
LPGGTEIDFNVEEAIRFIDRWYRTNRLWNDRNDPLRKAMGRLLFEVSNDPLYNTELYLREFNWDQIKISSDNFFLWDSIHIMVPIKDSFLIEPMLVDTLKTIGDSAIDSLNISDTIPERMIIDSLSNSERPLIIESIPVLDSIILVVSDTLKEVFSTNPEFPFRYYNYPLTGDSIHSALDILMREVIKKDSSIVVFKGSGEDVPLRLSSSNNNMVRLWIKNEWGEDISLWLGREAHDTIKILVEEGVHFRRLKQETKFANAQIDVRELDNKTLGDVKLVEVVPNYWKFLSEASFTFNQAMLKNWSKGGESNIAFTSDLQGIVDYTDKKNKISWNTIGRFKFGYMASGMIGKKDDLSIRKNIDQIDIASKYNTKAFGKFDFSSTMIFKTQLARGYAYPNDSVVISKFFNPATLTLGFGLDYKPNKNTSINFAPLAYKGTYVPDTVMIDQTKHGLTKDQRARHEPGISAQVDHKVTIFKSVTLINKVRLFTNYINNPLNIDIEWEMIATAKLNWFTDVRLNTHFIYDDDTLIPLFNDDGSKVLGSDGNQKKVPMVQFKEIIGVSIIFRF